MAEYQSFHDEGGDAVVASHPYPNIDTQQGDLSVPYGNSPYQGSYAPPPSGQHGQPGYAAAYPDPEKPQQSGFPSDSQLSSATRFPVQAEAKDVFWKWLFFVQFIVVIVFAGIYFGKDMPQPDQPTPAPGPAPSPSEPSEDDSFPKGTKATLAYASLVALGLCAGFALVLQRFARQFIYAMLSCSIVLISVLIYVARRHTGIVIALSILLVIKLVYLIWARQRIRFASILLSMSAECVRAYPATVGLAMASVILQVGYAILWAGGLVGFHRYLDVKGKDEHGLYIVLLLLSVFWTVQVIANVVHTTVSGVMAGMYFFDSMPENPTKGSLGRALTTSFGSICLGSLIVAVIQTARALIKRGSRGKSVGFLAACALCLLDWLEAIAKYFNHYAYVRVAMYNESFREAGRGVMELFRTRGFSVVINDDIVRSALFVGSLFVGALTGGAAALIASKEIENTSNHAWFSVCIVAAVIGVISATTVTTVIWSGVSTLYVCMAEDPHRLKHSMLSGHYSELSSEWRSRFGEAGIELWE